jgi:hypothetical protein
MAKRMVEGDDGRMEGRENDAERYRKIIRRAKEVRDRAAESLRRARAFRKARGEPDERADAAQKRRTLRRRD